jgi:hypothetical protein
MNDLRLFFTDELEELPCDANTKAYIITIFAKYKTTAFDLSKQSITLHYAEAKTKQDFAMFQTIADWLFFCSSIFPEHLNGASTDYYHTVGQLSYHSCYKLINKTWPVYECLADEFVPLTLSTRAIIQQL